MLQNELYNTWSISATDARPSAVSNVSGGGLALDRSNRPGTDIELERTPGSAGGAPGAAVSRRDGCNGGIVAGSPTPPKLCQEQSQTNSGGGVASLSSTVQNKSLTDQNLLDKNNSSLLLVGIRHNSRNSCVTTPVLVAEKSCQNRTWMRGECGHGTVRWLSLPCKRRDCEVCGPAGRYEISQRIAYGIRQNWPCAWLVLTFKHDVTKKEAVKKLGKFLNWLRYVPKRGPGRQSPNLQYAATYELTKAGRLHINLIAGPWKYMPLDVLLKAWGARLSVELVQDNYSMAKEATKAYSPESLGGYLSKLEQCVPDDRRVSYSKDWPELPDPPQRKGAISWRPAIEDEDIVLEGEIINGEWKEVRPGEYRSRWGEECECFEFDNGDLVSESVAGSEDFDINDLLMSCEEGP